MSAKDRCKDMQSKLPSLVLREVNPADSERKRDRRIRRKKEANTIKLYGEIYEIMDRGFWISYHVLTTQMLTKKFLEQAILRQKFRKYGTSIKYRALGNQGECKLHFHIFKRFLLKRV